MEERQRMTEAEAEGTKAQLQEEKSKFRANAMVLEGGIEPRTAAEAANGSKAEEP